MKQYHMLQNLLKNKFNTYFFYDMIITRNMVINMKDLKVVFMGTPDLAVPILEELINTTNVVLVVTKADAYVGRKKVLTPSPVANCAAANNIEVYKPSKLKEEYEYILSKKPDIIITCAYGKIVPKVILDYPKYGCINVHASLLPKYRGANPIQQAIYNGEEKTGVTLMYMDEGIDTGNIIDAIEVPILWSDTLLTLESKISDAGIKVLRRSLPKIIAGENFDLKQDEEEATYVGYLKREDERIDFTRTAKEVYNHIRSMFDTPLANFTLNGEEIKVTHALIGEDSYPGKTGYITSVTKTSIGIMCQDQEITILEIKPSGKNMMLVRDWLNGKNKEELLGAKVNGEN